LEVALAKNFTPLQKAFIGAYLAHGDKERAAIDAGYSADTANSIAYNLLRQPAIIAAVQIGIAHDLAIGAVKANRVLQDFVADEKLDKRLRYACAKTILDRAGHIAPKAVAQGSTAAKPLNEMSMSELRELADKLENELSGRAKDVSSAKAAPAKAQTIDDIM
jgi:hypothetical protein